MLHPGQELALRRAVALRLSRDDDAWHVLQPLEQLAEKLLCGFLVAAALHQNVEDIIVLIHGAPQVIALAVDRQKDLVEMPFISRARPATLALVGVILPKLPTPLPDGFMSDINPACE